MRDRKADQSGDVVDLQFVHQATAIRVDGFGRQMNRAGDLRTGVALDDELKDFALSGAESAERTGLVG